MEILSKNKNIAFTLAEILIVLAIIGIIAESTIPTLIEKTEEEQNVIALKKFYSSISQAYLEVKNDNGTPDEWYTDDENTYTAKSNTMFEKFKQYLRISKACYQDKGCFPDVIYKKIDGSNATNWSEWNGSINTFLTADGMSVFFFSYGSTPTNYGSGLISESYGAISVDINGFKKPNVFGRDMFSFELTKDGIVPIGTQNWSISKLGPGFPEACNRKDCYGWCEGCTAWVIYNGNMDYLHCDDLSWTGKTSCN